MKKNLVLMILIFVFLLSSCDFTNLYKLNYPELFTEATSSLLGVIGYQYNDILLIETDDYGRGLFTYSSTCNDKNNVLSLMIYQKKDDKYIYYYSDYNYIICPTDDICYDKYNPITNDDIKKYFSEDDILQLKTQNDWNKKLDENKFFKVKVYRQKSNPIADEHIKEAFITKSPDKEFDSRYSDYLVSDRNDNSIYFVRGIDENYNYTKSYIIFFNKKGKFDKEKGIEEVKDIWNYAQQLREFKEKNGWDKSK